MSSINPFEAPNPDPTAGQDRLRQSALRNVRLCLVVLTIPAVYNLVCFSSTLSVPQRAANLYGIINGIGAVAVFVAIWWLGLAALEFISAILFRIFARSTNLTDWNSTLYSSLSTGPLLALFGAVLWIAWTVGFYKLNIDFYTLSVPVGIAAHLLAACMYLPLFARWYSLERTSRLK